MRNAALFLALISCAPYSRRVPEALLQKLPYESKIELLEAENELALAVDRLDEARAEIQRAREATRRAKERLAAAEDEVGDAKEPLSKEVAELAVAEAEARVAFLRRRQEQNLRQESMQELSLSCARANFELARLKVAKKAKVEGSESIPQPDFEEQLRACEEAVSSFQAAAKEKAQELAAAREAWEKSKHALAKKTFDARASPYVE